MDYFRQASEKFTSLDDAQAKTDAAISAVNETLDSIDSQLHVMSHRVTELEEGGTGGPPPQPNLRPKLYVTPEEFGGRANSGQDDYEALYRCFSKLDGKPQHRMTVKLLGHYLTKQPLVIHESVGLRVEGAGLATHYESPNGRMSHGTAGIIYHGPPDNSCLTYYGSGLVLDGVFIAGRDDGPAVGLHISKRQPGLGSGKCHLRSVAIHNCGVGIRFGSNEHTHNCDNVTAEYLYLRDCKTGYQAVNEQAVGHYIRTIHPYHVGTVFDFENGGCFSVIGGKILQGTDTFLKIGDIGSNNGIYAVRDIQCDVNNNGAVWIDHEGRKGPARILLEGCHVSGKPDTPKRIRLGGYDQLTLRGFHDLRKGMITGKSQKRDMMIDVVAERCTIAAGGQPRDVLDDDCERLRFSWRDCCSWDGNRIIDDSVAT